MIPLLLFALLQAPPSPTIVTTAGNPAGVTVVWEYPAKTFSVYRGSGLCGTVNLAPIASGVPARVDDAGNPFVSFSDTPGTSGEYCYLLTADDGTVSGAVQAYVAPPFPVPFTTTAK